MSRPFDPNSVRFNVMKEFEKGYTDIDVIAANVGAMLGKKVHREYCYAIISKMKRDKLQVKKTRAKSKVKTEPRSSISIKSLQVVADFVKEAGGIKNAIEVMNAFKLLSE